jgi:hypothetical protein
MSEELSQAISRRLALTEAICEKYPFMFPHVANLLAEHDAATDAKITELAGYRTEFFRQRSRADAHEENYNQMLARVSALIAAGDKMDLLLTGSAKPSKEIREGWQNAKEGKK